METKSKLENELKNAMRAHDEVRKRTIRMALSSIRFAEVEKGVKLDETAVLAALQKEVKTRQESIEEAQRAGRPDLANATQEEIEVLQSFLPQPFSPEELEKLVRETIAEAGATSPADMGKVMKLLTPRLQGRATGSQASQLVRQRLQS